MNKTKDEFLALAKGCWQRELLQELLEGELESPFKFLRGRAREYQGRYAESFSNLLGRLEDNGFDIVRFPGPHGGDLNKILNEILPEEGLWNAVYRIK